jgi:hypothetical protein
MRTTQHLSLEELTGNLVEVLNQVRKEHTTVVVEYASGEKLIIQSLPPTKKKPRRSRKPTKPDQEAGKGHPSLPSARLGAREDQIDHTLEHPPKRELNAGVASLTGAVFDLDPHSVSPG